MTLSRKAGHLLLAGLAFAACANATVEEPPAAGICSKSAVDHTNSAGALRNLVDNCKRQTDVALSALTKLNALPLPVERITKLQPEPSHSQKKAEGASSAATTVAHASYEVAVYFGTGESFPPEEGLAAMAQLIERVNTSGGRVKSVAIVGMVDAAEAGTAMARPLARGRAEILHRYLVAAGVAKERIQAAIKTRPSGSASPTPSDRAAHVVMIVEVPASAARRV